MSAVGSVKSLVQKTSASLSSSPAAADEGGEKEKRPSSRSDDGDCWLQKLVESMVRISWGNKKGGKGGDFWVSMRRRDAEFCGK